MSSLILRTAARYLLPLLLLFSIFLLVRGHHEPGGGFIGGLIAGTAIALCALAFDVSSARRIVLIAPQQLMGAGLTIAALSGLAGVAAGRPFLTSVWGKLPLGRGAPFEAGTPLLFDVGVYLSVMGVVLLIVFSMAEEQVK